MSELKDVVAQIEKKQSELLTAIEAKAGTDVLETLKSDLQAFASEKMKEVEEMNIKQGEELELLKKAQAERGVQPKTLNEAITASYTKGLNEFKAKGSQGMIEVPLFEKAAGVIGDPAAIPLNVVGDIPQAMREAGINKTPIQTMTIRSLMFNGTTDSPVIDWIEKVGQEGTPIPLAECDSFPLEDTDYAPFSTTVKKIGGLTKVTEEKLEDITWMMNEIRSELIERHEIVVENQLLAGDGAGLNIKGLIPDTTGYSVPFVAETGFLLNIPAANHTDVIRLAILQVAKAFHSANAIVLNPSDVASMELEKTDTGVYTLPPFRSADGLTVKGIRVVETTAMPAGKFLVGDFSKAGVFVRRSPRLEIGYDQDDFSTDKRTVKLSERLAMRVKGRDLEAFVYGDFAAAIAAIDKP